MSEQQTSLAFCENGECEVVTYNITYGQDVANTNCPGCGRFGRIKDAEEGELYPVDPPTGAEIVPPAEEGRNPDIDDDQHFTDLTRP